MFLWPAAQLSVPHTRSPAHWSSWSQSPWPSPQGAEEVQHDPRLYAGLQLFCPKNDKKHSSCSFLNFRSIPWSCAVEHVKKAKRMHNTDTLMDNMDIVSDAKWVTNLFYFTLLTIYTLVQVLQKPQTNQKCECFWCSSEFYRGFTRLNFQEF